MNALCEFFREASTVEKTFQKNIKALFFRTLLAFYVFMIAGVNVLNDMPFVLRSCSLNFYVSALEAQFLLQNVFFGLYVQMLCLLARISTLSTRCFIGALKINTSLWHIKTSKTRLAFAQTFLKKVNW